MTEHLDLTTLFDRIGCEAILHLSNDYYHDLIREFYANMLHEKDKDLYTIISSIKGFELF